MPTAGLPAGGADGLPPPVGGGVGGRFEAWSTRTSKCTVPLGGGVTWPGATCAGATGAGGGAGGGVWAQTRVQEAPITAAVRYTRRRSIGPRAARSRLRALWSLDITVPIGQLSTVAISRYDNPSTSLSMIMARALGGKVSR